MQVGDLGRRLRALVRGFFPSRAAPPSPAVSRESDNPSFSTAEPLSAEPYNLQPTTGVVPEMDALAAEGAGHPVSTAGNGNTEARGLEKGLAESKTEGNVQVSITETATMEQRLEEANRLFR